MRLDETNTVAPTPRLLLISIKSYWQKNVRRPDDVITLARKRCFATFAGVGGGVWCDPPLAFPNEAS